MLHFYFFESGISIPHQKVKGLSLQIRLQILPLQVLQELPKISRHFQKQVGHLLQCTHSMHIPLKNRVTILEVFIFTILLMNLYSVLESQIILFH